MIIQDCSAAILCGGKSSRMGCPKAELDIQGRAFLDTIADHVWVFGELIMSVGTSGCIRRTLPCVQDVFPCCGPMGGIHAALGACSYSVLFVTACDTPLVDNILAEELLSMLREEDDAVIPLGDDGQIHPLCGVYRKWCATVLEDQLKAGKYRMRDALGLLRVRYVPLMEIPDAKNKLCNINTPEEYQRLTEQIRRKTG